MKKHFLLSGNTNYNKKKKRKLYQKLTADQISQLENSNNMYTLIAEITFASISSKTVYLVCFYLNLSGRDFPLFGFQ